jgi:hypothetical protein
MRLVRGRELTEADQQAPVALINETCFNRFLAGRDPLGASFSIWDWPGISFTVVGVVGDTRQWGPEYPPLPEVYLPQRPFSRNAAAANEGATLMLKTRLPQGELERALRKAAMPFDGDLLVGPVRTLDDYLAGYLRLRRLELDLALAFAAAALALAALGVYGAMAFSVAQRRRELSVRAALGAEGRALSLLVLRQGARIVAAGIILGLAGGLALSRIFAAVLYGVSARDPVSFCAAAVVLALIALAACLLPARAAAKADPIVALRAE